MKLKTKIVSLIAVLTVIVIFIGTSKIGAFTQIDRSLNFSSVGMVRGQTIQVNFTNNGSEVLKINFLVLDDGGKNYLPAVQQEVLPGRTVHAALGADDIPFLEGRAQVRAKVQVTGDRSINFFGSAEIIDNDTQKTEIFLPAVQ